MTIEETVKELKQFFRTYCTQPYPEYIQDTIKILEKVRDGKMIELPCKVGDTVYVIGENDIAELEIKYIDFTDTGEHYHAFCKMKKLCNCDYEYGDSCLVEEEICYMSFTNYDFGRKVFINKEEAEKALKERK